MHRLLREFWTGIMPTRGQPKPFIEVSTQGGISPIRETSTSQNKVGVELELRATVATALDLWRNRLIALRYDKRT
jgi:hypothetical protein